MKTKLTTILSIVLLVISCGGKEEKKEDSFSYQKKTNTEKTTKKVADVPASKRIDLSTKGIGPIKSVSLDVEINQVLVSQGADIFKKMCTACHRTNKKFIGPSPTNVLERRSPEWIMNMILNPEEMTQKDPLARALLIEFNGSPMANQSLSEEEARAVLEYFRTLK